MFDRSTTVAFTGHRTYCHEADEVLCEEVRRLCLSGFRTFLSGMAAGFDLAAAEVVMALREEFSEVQLVAVIPFAGQGERMNSADRARYEAVVAAADHRVVLAPSFYKGCYQVRNRYLVQHAARIVAWYNGSAGGTQQTYLMALHRGLHVENLGRVVPDRRLF